MNEFNSFSHGEMIRISWPFINYQLISGYETERNKLNKTEYMGSVKKMRNALELEKYINCK